MAGIGLSSLNLPVWSDTVIFSFIKAEIKNVFLFCFVGELDQSYKIFKAPISTFFRFFNIFLRGGDTCFLHYSFLAVGDQKFRFFLIFAFHATFHSIMESLHLYAVETLQTKSNLNFFCIVMKEVCEQQC